MPEGGVAFGLKLVYGDAVHCLFAEPTASPAMLLGVLTDRHDAVAVQDFGLSNLTAADGLAVGRPSGFVGRGGSSPSNFQSVARIPARWVCHASQVTGAVNSGVCNDASQRCALDSAEESAAVMGGIKPHTKAGASKRIRRVVAGMATS